MKHREVLKHFINVLAVIILSLVAFLFIAYGFLEGNLSFFEVYLKLLTAVTGVVTATLAAAGILFYFLKKQSSFRLIVCILIFADVFAVVFYALCATKLIGKINSVEALREYISNAGNWATVIYIVFCFLQVVLLPVPGSVAVGVGVAMFGPFKCAVYGFIGIAAGSLLAFLIGRKIGYKAVCWIVGQESLDKWLEKLKGKDYLILSIMFLLPMFPDDILCFVAGLSSMTWKYYFVMVMATRAISVFTTAYSFELIPFTTWWGIIIWLVLASLVIVSFWLVCKYSESIDTFMKSKFKLKKKGD